MKTKKLLSLFLIVTMVLSLFCVSPLSASAATTEDGKFTFTVSGQNATITGYDNNKFTPEELEDLVIPETLVTESGDRYTVVAIGQEAIGGKDKNSTNKDKIVNVTLPECVKSIGKNGLSWIPALETVSMPGVTSIGTHGFYGCSALTTVYAPVIESIGATAFYNCSKLAYFNSDVSGEVILPKSLKSIGKQAFRPCNSIKTFIIPPSIESMGEGGQFGNTKGLRNVYFPDTVTSDIYNNFAGKGFSQNTDLTTINAYGSKNSYVKEYAASDTNFFEGTVSGESFKSDIPIYNFIEENGDLLVMDGTYKDANGLELTNDSKSVGFNARLFNTNTESALNVTAIIGVYSSGNELKGIGTYGFSIPAWQGKTLDYSDLNATNVTFAEGDKVKVMFWVNTTDDLTPVVTQKLEEALTFS